jgi:hypothetical protein
MMEKEVKKKIEEMLVGMNCPKDFKCTQGGFERLCKAREFGIESHLECLEEDPSECPFAFSFGYCLEEDPSECPFAFSFGYRHMCQCPLRVYIAKKLKK